MTDIQTVDVLIIGSGPTGASTALHLVQMDPGWARRLVVVDKAVHPRDKLCGGGITHLGQNVLARLGLAIEPTHFEVNQVRLVYQDQSYTFRGRPVFRIVRRAEFDHWLVRQAEARGVVVRQGEAVKDVTVHDEYVEVITDKAVYHARALVAADGSRSIVRQKLKWEGDSHVARLLEVLTPEDPQRQPEFRDGVAIFDFTPMDDGLQGYYWDFPSYVSGRPFMNRGVFDSRARPERPKASLPDILRHSMATRERRLEDYQLKGHPIRWFDKDETFSQPHVILAGDAAGADPLFGEGISFALGFGKVAAEALDDAFRRQDFSFAGYKARILSDSLLRQLPIRVGLARLAYRLQQYPWLVRLGWQAARWLVQITPWRDPDYVPAEPPRLALDYRWQQ